MNTTTKATPRQNTALTPDPLLAASSNWAVRNRRGIYVGSAVVLLVVILAIIAGAVYKSRSDAAATAFGEAMQVYQAPIASAAQPPQPDVKTYGSAAERAKAANTLFTSIADKYGMTTDGRNARYFAGLTAMEEGQNQTAETTLKQVSGSWDTGLAALAKLALADLYRQTGRDGQAIELYNQLGAKDSVTVPAATAQIALAELYTAEGKTEQARKIYAQIVDKDKTAKGKPGVASTIASQKLNPQAAAGPGEPPQ